MDLLDGKTKTKKPIQNCIYKRREKGSALVFYFLLYHTEVTCVIAQFMSVTIITIVAIMHLAFQKNGGLRFSSIFSKMYLLY